MTRVPATNSNAFVSNLRYWVAACILLSLALATTLLLLRSLDGRLPSKLSFWMALGTLGSALGLVNVARCLWATESKIVRWALPAVPIFVLAATLVRHLAEPSLTAAIWLCALAAELGVAIWLGRPQAALAVEPESEPSCGKGNAPAEMTSSVAAPKEPTAANLLLANESEIDEGDGSSDLFGSSEEDEIDEESITQQMTRSLTSDGTETIAGRVRVDFQANERQSSAHLAFTPPLRNVPEVFVDQSSGPSAAVTPGSIYAHGARVDVRLENAVGEPSSVWFEIYVVSPNGTEERPAESA